MNMRPLSVAAGLGLLFASAVPTQAQLANMPVGAQHFGAPATTLAASWGVGLNEDSGKNNAFGAFLSRSGEKLSFGGGANVVNAGDNDVSVAGNVAFALMQGASFTLGVQGGVGWYGPGDLTLLSFPIGVSIVGNIETSEASITPWAMPRLNIARVSNGTSSTDTDFGASGGLDFSFGGAFGAGVALDVVVADGVTPILFGLAGSYTFGG